MKEHTKEKLKKLPLIKEILEIRNDIRHNKLIKEYEKRRNHIPLSQKRRETPIEPWAFIRVHNEIATIEACLQSIVPVIKKGVIAYHKHREGDVDDGTIEYIKNFCQDNKGFILYEYPYEVFPGGDSRYLKEVKVENRLDTYYNAVFDHIPEGEWFLKIDADHIYDTEKLKQLMYLPKKDTDVISIGHINVHYEDNKLYYIENDMFGIKIFHDSVDHWLVKKKDLHFYFHNSVDEKTGAINAFEVLNINEKIANGELTLYRTDLFNWHFRYLKNRRNKAPRKIDFDIEYM